MTSTQGSRTPLLVKARLVAEVAITYARARRMLRTRTLPETLASLRVAEHPTDKATSLEGSAWLAGVVVRTLRVLPVDDRCLIQALVLTGLLARRGVSTVFVLGVRPGEAFAAHAWVELDGRPLLAPREHEFQRLAEL